jgi:hypothetical protein
MEFPKRPLRVVAAGGYRDAEKVKRPSCCNRGAYAIHVDTHLWLASREMSLTSERTSPF